MLKYPILIFSKWDFIAGLKCFFFFFLMLPTTKKGGWKSWEHSKTAWNCRNKYSIILNILWELPFWWFYPFRNPKAICKYPFPILLWWLREGYEMQHNMVCSKLLLVPFFHSAWSTMFWLHEFSQVYSFSTQETVCIDFLDIGSHLRQTYHTLFCLANRIMDKIRATNMWHVSLPGREFEVEASCKSYVL